MKNEESQTEVKQKIKKKEDVDTKENVKVEKGTRCATQHIVSADRAHIDTKKRSRDPPPTTSPKSERSKAKQEVVEEEEDDDEDDEPVLKRPRRNGRADIEDAKPTNSKAKTAAKAEPAMKSKSMPPPPKTTKDEDEVDEVEEVSSKSKVAKRRDSNASASASEIEEGVEEDEEEDEDEDEEEKPEVAAKAREKIQSTLKAKTKDPYPDWKPGEPVPYAALCTTFSLIEMTTKRLVIIAHCSLFLRQVLRLTPDDMLPTVLLMINKLAADYAGIELGIGESLIMKAIGESTGRSLAVIKQDQKEIGDLGLVAVKSRANQPTMFKPKALTVRGVHKGLMDIATVTGNGAQGRKVDGIKKLLSAADGHMSGKVDITKDKGGPSEAKFVVRFLEGKLRLGLAEKSVLVSLAQAMVCHEIEAKGSGKVPSTEQLANGESILKAVYR
jgi:DNA ligase-1